jgi:hypothetical protein
MKHPSLAGMVNAIKGQISREALHYRFTANAAAFLLQCLHYVLQQKFSGQIDTKLLRPFRRVLIVDSSGMSARDCALFYLVPAEPLPQPTANYRPVTTRSMANWDLGDFLRRTAQLLRRRLFAATILVRLF